MTSPIRRYIRKYSISALNKQVQNPQDLCLKIKSCHSYNLLRSSPLLPWQSPSSGCPVPKSKSLSSPTVLPLLLPSPLWASEHGTWINQTLLKLSQLHSRLDTDTWIALQFTAMKKRWAVASRTDWRRLGSIDPVSGLHQSCGMISKCTITAT